MRKAAAILGLKEYLRLDAAHTGRSRALAVVAATVYVFVLVRIAPEVAVVLAPVFPFTGLGVADHVNERRVGRV